MGTVSDFPQRDLIAEMKGPDRGGCSVIVDGRLVPNMAMHDRGETIEFVLDNRMSWSFPRAEAWNAASFAFTAMALGAGFASPSAMHFTQRAFAPECIKLDDKP